MKTVFSSNREAIHIFANNPERHGRSSSISFGGGVLFSYNTAIAQHATNDKGETILIINQQSYSNTTSKQQSILGSATWHKDRINIRFIPYDTQSLKPSKLDNSWLIARYESHAAELLVKASRARLKADDYRAEAFNLLKELQVYFAFFGIKYKLGNMEKLESAAIKADKKQKELDKKLAAQRIKEQAEALEAWRKGENKRNYFEVTALRVKGDEIETTKGARVPVEHAAKIWPLLKRLHDKGETYHANGHSLHLGHYTITSFERDILTVGCHKIPFSEVSQIANQLHLN